VKKFWDTNYHGGSYDAAGRRANRASVGENGPSKKAPSIHGNFTPNYSALKTQAAKPVNSAITRQVQNQSLNSSTSLAQVAEPSPEPILRQTISNLNKSLTEMRLTVDEMEKERDFYFGKLRDIEIACQGVSDPMLMESSLFRQITGILYKTEDGFEIPTDNSTLN